MKAASIASAAGSLLLHAVPRGFAIRLWQLNDDFLYWAELEPKNPDGERLKAWKAKPLASPEDGIVAWGKSHICPIANLAGNERVPVEFGEA